ncbi:MAG: hypothetical protein MJ149_02155 [Clostridia bacterium]|nr:hypothetical protein [Clostridia bacterium]
MAFDMEKFMKDADKHYKKHGRDLTFMQAEDKIAELSNPELAYRFVREVKGADKQKFADIILASGNAEFIYLAARSFDLSIEPFQEAIIKIGDPKWITYFAKYVAFADVDALQAAVINSFNAKYISKFATNVRFADVELLEKALLKTKDAHHIAWYCHDAKIKDPAKLREFEDVVLESNNISDLLDWDILIMEGNSGRVHDKMLKLQKAKNLSK